MEHTRDLTARLARLQEQIRLLRLGNGNGRALPLDDLLWTDDYGGYWEPVDNPSLYLMQDVVTGAGAVRWHGGSGYPRTDDLKSPAMGLITTLPEDFYPSLSADPVPGPRIVRVPQIERHPGADPGAEYAAQVAIGFNPIVTITPWLPRPTFLDHFKTWPPYHPPSGSSGALEGSYGVVGGGVWPDFFAGASNLFERTPVVASTGDVGYLQVNGGTLHAANSVQASDELDDHGLHAEWSAVTNLKILTSEQLGAGIGLVVRGLDGEDRPSAYLIAHRYLSSGSVSLRVWRANGDTITLIGGGITQEPFGFKNVILDLWTDGLYNRLRVRSGGLSFDVEDDRTTNGLHTFADVQVWAHTAGADIDPLGPPGTPPLGFNYIRVDERSRLMGDPDDEVMGVWRPDRLDRYVPDGALISLDLLRWVAERAQLGL